MAVKCTQASNKGRPPKSIQTQQAMQAPSAQHFRTNTQQHFCSGFEGVLVQNIAANTAGS
jgi:hypothetical protein